MNKVQSWTTGAPSMAVMQGAYQSFCTPQTTEIAGKTDQLNVSRHEVLGLIYVIVFQSDPPVDDWLKFSELAVAWR